jgi:hypothetical protein
MVLKSGGELPGSTTVPRAVLEDEDRGAVVVVVGVPSSTGPTSPYLSGDGLASIGIVETPMSGTAVTVSVVESVGFNSWSGLPVVADVKLAGGGSKVDGVCGAIA